MYLTAQVDSKLQRNCPYDLLYWCDSVLSLSTYTESLFVKKKYIFQNMLTSDLVQEHIKRQDFFSPEWFNKLQITKKKYSKHCHYWNAVLLKALSSSEYFFWMPFFKNEILKAHYKHLAEILWADFSDLENCD